MIAKQGNGFRGTMFYKRQGICCPCTHLYILVLICFGFRVLISKPRLLGLSLLGLASWRWPPALASYPWTPGLLALVH